MQPSTHFCRPALWSPGWPTTDLDDFASLMHGQGLIVSKSLMKFDRHYAMDQLALAHTLADRRLRGLAVALFEQVEEQIVGQVADWRGLSCCH